MQLVAAFNAFILLDLGLNPKLTLYQVDVLPTTLSLQFKVQA